MGLSWQIQRQAGTPKALSYAVESLGFSPNISAWYQQRPQGVPYTFDVQAIIGRSWSSGDHNPIDPPYQRREERARPGERLPWFTRHKHALA